MAIVASEGAWSQDLEIKIKRSGGVAPGSSMNFVDAFQRLWYAILGVMKGGAYFVKPSSVSLAFLKRSEFIRECIGRYLVYVKQRCDQTRNGVLHACLGAILFILDLILRCSFNIRRPASASSSDGQLYQNKN